jgi:hypothetical protein
VTKTPISSLMLSAVARFISEPAGYKSLLAHLVKNLEAWWPDSGRQAGAARPREKIAPRHRCAPLGHKASNRRVRWTRRGEPRNLPAPLGDSEALPRLHLDQVLREALPQLSDANLVHVRHGSD